MGLGPLPSRPFAGVLLAGQLLACGSAGGESAPGPTGLPEARGELACRPLTAEATGREATELFPAGSGFGALYARERVVELWDGHTAPTREIAFDREGPAGVLDAAGAALAADTLLVLADRPRGRLKLLDLEGRDAGIVELGFPPQAVAVAGDRLFAARFVLEADDGTLLHRVEPASPAGRPRPVEIAALADDDAGWQALGNLVSLAPGAGGSLFLLHRLARARAYRLPADGGTPRPLRLALADREAARLGVRPPTPFGEEALERVAVPVVDASGDDRPGGWAYLTRSGRRTGDGRAEKLLVRMAAGGRVGAVHRVPVDGRQLLRVPAAGLWVVADEERLWGCTGPGRPGSG